MDRSQGGSQTDILLTSSKLLKHSEKSVAHDSCVSSLAQYCLVIPVLKLYL